jgi:hypothetical protein
MDDDGRVLVNLKLRVGKEEREKQKPMMIKENV